MQFADGCGEELLYIILRCFDQSYVLDIIWCFCYDSALYQMHLYELRKKVFTTEIAQQCPDSMREKNLPEFGSFS